TGSRSPRLPRILSAPLRGRVPLGVTRSPPRSAFRDLPHDAAAATRDALASVAGVTEPSGARCAHAPACVPCPFRGLAYRVQLARKKQRIEAAFASRPALSGVAIEEAVGSRDLFGYRN